MELWARKIPECCKQNLVGHFSGRLEDRNTERNMDSRLSAHEVPEDSLRNQDRDHLCVILAKNLALFYPCPDNLSESEFKGKRLIYWAEEISRQNIQLVSEKAAVVY